MTSTGRSAAWTDQREGGPSRHRTSGRRARRRGTVSRRRSERARCYAGSITGDRLGGRRRWLERAASEPSSGSPHPVTSAGASRLWPARTACCAARSSTDSTRAGSPDTRSGTSCSRAWPKRAATSSWRSRSCAGSSMPTARSSRPRRCRSVLIADADEGTITGQVTIERATNIRNLRFEPANPSRRRGGSHVGGRSRPGDSRPGLALHQRAGVGPSSPASSERWRRPEGSASTWPTWRTRRGWLEGSVSPSTSTRSSSTGSRSTWSSPTRPAHGSRSTACRSCGPTSQPPIAGGTIRSSSAPHSTGAYRHR